MKLTSSPKIYNNYKCDNPKDTIDKIEEGFKKLGLDVSYKDKKIKDSNFTIYISKASINILGIDQYGKGVTKELAKASAYAEMVERFSTGTTMIIIPFSKKPGRYQNILKNINEKKFLKGHTIDEKHRLIDTKSINQYFQRKITKKQFEKFKKDGTLDIFVDAYSIIKKDYVKIPIDLIEIFSNTNGLAAGNTMEEAISQASFEIFERYVSNKIVSEKIICPTIDPNSIQDEVILNCIKMLEKSNIEVIIKDFTMNNIFPVIAVLFVDHNIENDDNKLKHRDYRRINVGSHINLKEAVKRCFDENLQVIKTDKQKLDLVYTLWTKNLQKKYVGMDDDFRYFVRDYHYYGDLSFLEKGEKIDFNSLTSYENDDSLKDIKRIREICNSNKWDFLVIDYTHKVLKFPTVRVIIPPISIDFDPFVNKALEINGLENKFNYFYGINDFYGYLKDDSWIKNKNKIEKLIENIEKYLSKELDHYYFFINREINFYHLINTIHILPFLYLSLNKLKDAKKCFEALIELNFHPPTESTFYKELYREKYNPEIYKTYISKINKSLKKNKKYNFELKSNPFNPDTCTEEMEKIYIEILKNINESFK